jgi:DNA-binding response OmpR family regulator
LYEQIDNNMKHIMPKKILIVEDNPLMLEVMTYILISNGYEVFALSNGNEVFNNIKRNHPDLVIIESVLPGIGGLEMCQLIKLNYTTRDLPVIMCTGDGEQTDSLLEQTGAPDDVLEKPFDIKSLIQKVEYQLAA